MIDGTGRSRKSLGAALVAAAILVAVAGLEGLVAGGLLLAAWRTLPTPFPFAVGQVGFAATGHVSLTPLVIIGELALVGLLLQGIAPSQASGKAAGGAVATGGILGIVSVMAAGSTSPAGLSLTVGLIASILIYGLHRYQKVSLNLVNPVS